MKLTTGVILLSSIFAVVLSHLDKKQYWNSYNHEQNYYNHVKTMVTTEIISTSTESPVNKAELAKSVLELDNQIRQNEPAIGTVLHFYPNETLFRTSNKSAENVLQWEWQNATISHPVQLSREFNSARHELLRGSYLPNNTLPSAGFVQTVLEAYKGHHNLVIRPDDIWTAILCQLSLHVNANPEQYRNKFVLHEGTRTLQVSMDSIALSDPAATLTRGEWWNLLNQMKEVLLRDRNNRDRDWILNAFTTTKPRDIIVSSVALMTILQKYYKYEFHVLCGIPTTRVQGTVGDWEKIKSRIERMGRWSQTLKNWAKLLLPIIEKFIEVRNGDVDAEFWGDICKVQATASCPTGKGDQFLDGWITAFAVFDAKGKWKGDKMEGWKWPRLNTKTLPSGPVAVPVEVFSRGQKMEAIIFAGHMGYTYIKQTIQPYSGWAIARTLRPITN